MSQTATTAAVTTSRPGWTDAGAPVAGTAVAGTADSPALLAAAHAVAAAECRRETAAAALAGAEARAAHVRGRTAALEREREAIIARRQRGQQAPDDGPRLALIAADLDGLAALQRDADAAVEAARRPAEDAARILATARHVLRQAEDDAARAALLDYAGRLDGLLLEAIAQLDALRERQPHRGIPAWGPSPPLWEALRRLRFQRGSA